MLMLMTLAGGEKGLSIWARGVPGTEESGVRNGSRRSSSMPSRLLSMKNRGLGGWRALSSDELGPAMASDEEDADEDIDGREGIVTTLTVACRWAKEIALKGHWHRPKVLVLGKKVCSSSCTSLFRT